MRKMNTFSEGEDCVDGHDPNVVIEDLRQMHFDIVESARPLTHHDHVDCGSEEINSFENHVDHESHEENNNDNSSSMDCRLGSEYNADSPYQRLQSIERGYLLCFFSV